MNVWGREELRNQLKKHEIAPVYLLFGEETYLRDVAAKTICNLAFKENSLREFNENEFSLNQPENLVYALASAEQLPMMAERRVVRITDVRISANGSKDTLKEDFEQILTAYLLRPAESSVVIFVADELDKRRRMAKLLIEHSTAVEFTKLKDVELISWARKEIRDEGFDIDEKALRYLIGLVGDNLRRLSNEIKKITTASLPEKIISYELVKTLVPYSRELSSFDLTDYLLSGNRVQSFEILQKILDDGAEPLMILGLIANSFRRLFMAKEMMNQGLERREVARVMKLPYSKQEDFLATARRTSSAKLAAILKRIAETDLAIKTSRGGGGNAGARLQIEMLLSELLGMKK